MFTFTHHWQTKCRLRVFSSKGGAAFICEPRIVIMARNLRAAWAQLVHVPPSDHSTLCSGVHFPKCFLYDYSALCFFLRILALFCPTVPPNSRSDSPPSDAHSISTSSKKIAEFVCSFSNSNYQSFRCTLHSKNTLLMYIGPGLACFLVCRCTFYALNSPINDSICCRNVFHRTGSEAELGGQRGGKFSCFSGGEIIKNFFGLEVEFSFQSKFRYIFVVFRTFRSLVGHSFGIFKSESNFLKRTGIVLPCPELYASKTVFEISKLVDLMWSWNGCRIHSNCRIMV